MMTFSKDDDTYICREEVEWMPHMQSGFGLCLVFIQDTWYGGFHLKLQCCHEKIIILIFLNQVSVPECQDLLSPVFALLEARTQHYSQVTHLSAQLIIVDMAGGSIFNHKTFLAYLDCKAVVIVLLLLGAATSNILLNLLISPNNRCCNFEASWSC